MKLIFTSEAGEVKVVGKILNLKDNQLFVLPTKLQSKNFSAEFPPFFKLHSWDFGFFYANMDKK